MPRGSPPPSQAKIAATHDGTHTTSQQNVTEWHHTSRRQADSAASGSALLSTQDDSARQLNLGWGGAGLSLLGSLLADGRNADPTIPTSTFKIFYSTLNSSISASINLRWGLNPSLTHNLYFSHSGMWNNCSHHSNLSCGVGGTIDV